MNISKEFGQILKAARINVQLSQRELAEKTKLDRTFISMLELGKRQPTISTVFKLSEHLDISPADLITKLEKVVKFRIRS